MQKLPSCIQKYNSSQHVTCPIKSKGGLYVNIKLHFYLHSTLRHLLLQKLSKATWLQVLMQLTNGRQFCVCFRFQIQWYNKEDASGSYHSVRGCTANNTRNTAARRYSLWAISEWRSSCLEGKPLIS